MKSISTIWLTFLDKLSDPENEKIINDDLPAAYYEPLQLACESKLPRVMEVALDAFHYMMGKSIYINFNSINVIILAIIAIIVILRAWVFSRQLVATNRSIGQCYTSQDQGEDAVRGGYRHD